MKIQIPACLFLLIVIFLASALTIKAASPVLVATGYYDEPPNQGYGGSNLPLPSPWYGSSNTTLYGSVAAATSSDPDLCAVLLENLGTSTATLTAASIGTSHDLFSFNSITNAVPLPPNQFVILEGPDGSDVSFTSVINVVINGATNSYPDAVNATYYPSGVLHGFPQSSDETVPWTTIYSPASVPAPQILSIQTTAGTNLLTWSSVFGQVYQLQSATNLPNATWVNLGAIQTATSATTSLIDPLPTAQKFYRVIQLNE